jgi:folate-dependent phosphoribosylglycinamide formyltransferase PurN
MNFIENKIGKICPFPPVLAPRVLFLGYGKEKTGLINELEKKGCAVFVTSEKICSTLGYDLVISFGYRHILRKSVIASSTAPIINLHISYLPWNKGAHPNFWSFFDCTPSGVTIHLIDEGVDTGPIIFQKYVNFDESEDTFSKTYRRLVHEVEALFIENIDAIIERKYTLKPQRRIGTFHKYSDLPSEFSGWDSKIDAEILRLDSVLGIDLTKKTIME